MTNPTLPKRYAVNMMCGDMMYSEEAIAYAEAVKKQARLDALEDVLDICTREGSLRSSSTEFNDVITKVRKLKEGV